MEELRAGGLVLYKRRPARVKDADAGGGRIEVETEGGVSQRVRPKDVVYLHSGPMTLAELQAPDRVEDIDSVRDLLSSEPDGVDLATLAEWLYGSSAAGVPSPAAVWAAWEVVAEGLHFEGTPDHVLARSCEQVEAERERRKQAAADAEAWEALLERIRGGACQSSDDEYLRDVEGLAEGRRQNSRLLKALGRAESPQNAHALLLNIGWWTSTRVPYPARAGVPVTHTPFADRGANAKPRCRITENEGGDGAIARSRVNVREAPAYLANITRAAVSTGRNGLKIPGSWPPSGF